MKCPGPLDVRAWAPAPPRAPGPGDAGEVRPGGADLFPPAPSDRPAPSETIAKPFTMTALQSLVAQAIKVAPRP